MKKKFLLLACILALGTTAFAADFAADRNSLNFKIGISDGEVDIDLEDLSDQDTSANISANLEYIASLSSGFEYGAGVGFTKFETNEGMELGLLTGDVDTYPIYGLARYKFDNESEFKPYVFGNLGYAFADEEFTFEDLSIEVEGGFYYAIGVGVEYMENFSAEFYWSKTELDFEFNEPGYSESEDVDGDMFTLAFGYRMDM